MSAALQAQAVAAALARPVERRGGRWHCQVCDRAFDSKQAIGPHQLSHRREVGLAPPRPPGARGLGKNVTCRSCGRWMTRTNYPRHLRQVHRLDDATVLRTIEEEAAAKRAGAAVVLAVEEEPAPPPGPDPLMTDLSAVDAAAGILNAARRDGLIPVGMLRPVMDWIGHTDQLLAELARQSGEARR
jgi:hypothetical protein